MSEDDRYTRVTLRIPKELTALLKEAADRGSHSMNAEIVQRLEGSFEEGGVKEVQAFASELLNATRLQRILSSNLIVHMTNSIIENNYKIDGMPRDYLIRLRESFSSGLGTEAEVKEGLTSFSRLTGPKAKNLPESILELLKHYGVAYPEGSQ